MRNMNPTILGSTEFLELFSHGDIDEWIADNERYAPGYLDMEEVGDIWPPNITK